jgi:predicted negative regulator of RcsB-dependent stress response
MTAPNSPVRNESTTPESILEWFELYSKQATWGAIAIIVIAAGGWFYIRTQNLKTERAEKAYSAAQRSVAAGNIPLAESDFRKLIGRYEGTAAAIQARLQLAQLLFDQGKVQEGVNELQQAEDRIGSSKDFGSSVHTVLAGGLEQLGKFRDAGAEYEKAAAAARFDPDRQRYLSMAAQAYLSGADTAKAKAIWTDLGADSKGTMAGEARVRLGELTATPAQPKT